MAVLVLARAAITLAQTVDIESVTWYYMLQASTAQAPAKPTTATPSGWTTTEPTYTEGSTNNLYICEKTVFSDGTFVYSDVSLSSSYEAAKAAYNKSVQAKATADAAQESIDGLVIGGRNLLLDSGTPHGSRSDDPQYISNYKLSDYGKSLFNNTETEFTISYDYEIIGDYSGASDSSRIYPMINGTAAATAHSLYVKDAPATGHRSTTTKMTQAQVTAGDGTIRTRWNGIVSGCTYKISNLKVEVGNKETAWTAAPEDAGDGRNLIINTLEPNTTALPRLLEQDSDTGVSTGATITTAEHGFRVTSVSGAKRPLIRFGSNDASATLQGLEPGAAYTLSFDAKWKVLSASTSNTTTYYMRAGLYDDAATPGTLASDDYLSFATIAKADKGTAMSGKCKFTFSVPRNVQKLYLAVVCTDTTASRYSAGDYIELSNIKLEKGTSATGWTPAPEDVEKGIEEAQKVATNYLTDITNNGVFVHPENDSQNGVQIQSNVDIIRGGVSVASYGQSARVGKTAGAHFVIEEDSLAGYSGEDLQGNSYKYFEIGGGNNIVTQIYRGNGSRTQFPLRQPVNGEDFTVKVGGNTVSNYTVDYTNEYITFTTAPAQYANIEITYTSSLTSRYFTFGNRLNEQTNLKGINSAVFGEDNIATGIDSFAQGLGTEAVEDYSAAFGKGGYGRGNIFSVGKEEGANGFGVDLDGNCAIGGQLKSGATASGAVPMFKIVDFNWTGIGISASDRYGALREITQSGYRAIAVTGWEIREDSGNGTTWQKCTMTQLYVYRTSGKDYAYYDIYNRDTAQANVQIYFGVLFIAESAM